MRGAGGGNERQDRQRSRIDPMHYLIGDLQGCCDAFERLLADIGFSPSRDQLYVLGDLVNRGPSRWPCCGACAAWAAPRAACWATTTCTCWPWPHGARPRAPQRHARRRSWTRPTARPCSTGCAAAAGARSAQGWLMVHAGVLPQWDAAQTLRWPPRSRRCCAGRDLGEFLPRMYGNEPARWSDALKGAARLRVVVNVLTRMRFCAADGALDFKHQGRRRRRARPGFALVRRARAGAPPATPIAFGHWSTLGLVYRADLLALDTGCVWGGALTAVRVDGGRREVLQVGCEPAASPRVEEWRPATTSEAWGSGLTQQS